MEMTDNLSKEMRSKVMASIKGKNTKPELLIRKILWAKGKRYRIHDRTVTGTPDISNKTKKIAIFIDGCFWHGCSRCYIQPKSNVEYWKKKIIKNNQRRQYIRKKLALDGWHILEFWEHEIIEMPTVVEKEIVKYI